MGSSRQLSPVSFYGEITCVLRSNKTWTRVAVEVKISAANAEVVISGIRVNG